jgi:hypothetical protein
MYDARMELNVERRMSNLGSAGRQIWAVLKLNPGGLQADRRGIVHRYPTMFLYADADALAHSLTLRAQFLASVTEPCDHVYPGLVKPLAIVCSASAFTGLYKPSRTDSAPYGFIRRA